MTLRSTSCNNCGTCFECTGVAERDASTETRPGADHDTATSAAFHEPDDRKG